MKVVPTVLGLAMAMVFAVAPADLFAQEVKPDEKKVEQKAEPKKEEPKKDPKVDEYEKAIKDLKKIGGDFTFYQKKKDILVELSEKELGKLFLLQATFHSGSSTNMTQAGDPVGPFEVQPFRWEKHDEHVWLVRPNIKYRWKENDPLRIAAERSLPEAVLGSFRIEQTHPEKKLYLVNITQLFYGDVFRLGELISTGTNGQYMLDREKSGPASVKSFPENSVVRMNLYYVSPRGQEMNPFMVALGLGGDSHLEDGRSLPISVTYNMWYRRDTGYKPRLADPRVGYFTQDFYNIDRFLEEDRTDRYIQRFNLVKKDPTASLSEPVQPIVWYIDTSVPKEYRQACKDGILRWNLAFEKLGFKNAVVVKDAPENDPEWDHADGRFNVFRWTMSPSTPYAIALARSDPFTGEVLNAGVTVDANMLQNAQTEQANVGVPSAEGIKRGLSVLTRMPNRRLTTEQILYGPVDHDKLEEAEALVAKFGWEFSKCRYGEGLRASADFAWNVLEAGMPGMAITREEYAKQFIRDVVSHEVGHTLGLRHNFVSSTHLSTAELADDDITNRESISASVMEYTPVNIQAILKGKGNFYAPTIGRYDYWAIQYGYSAVKGGTPSAERFELGKIASKSNQPGLAYMTDESADAWNPYVVRFDSSKDPLNYSARMLEAAKRSRHYAITKLPRPGESYAKRTKLILQSINWTFKQGRLAGRFVGGVVNSRNFYNGTASPTMAPVDPKIQREAVNLVAKECLSAEAFNLPASVLTTLSIDMNSNDGPLWNAPLRDQISSQQTMLVAMLLSAATTDRIAENAYKTPNGYSMGEHYAKIVNTVFSEVGKNQNVTPLRRDLQRFALGGLTTQAAASQGMVSEDVRLVATDSLRKLSAKMGAQLKLGKKLDAMTKLHLKDSKETIDRFLARNMAVSR